MAEIQVESPDPSTQDLPQKGRVGPGLAHILPISSLRFVLAIVVVLGHMSVPFLNEPQHGVLWALRALLNNAFDGLEAVMVFFVISGFCIHFPNRKGLEVKSWRAYYARRYLRILVPMTVALALSLPLHLEFGLFSGAILWSLVCEEIYYLLYPVLLVIRDWIGWRNLMIVSWLSAFAVVFKQRNDIQLGFFGPALTWIWGLPAWLLGCILAEKLDVFAVASIGPRQIWMWRISAWLLGLLANILEFHSPLKYHWTLPFYAVFAYFWLQREIRYYRTGSRTPFFEGLGEASYSIYLTHLHGFAAAGILISFGSPVLLWSSKLALFAVFAGVFYWLVERPSHRFARRCSRYFVPG